MPSAGVHWTLVFTAASLIIWQSGTLKQQTLWTLCTAGTVTHVCAGRAGVAGNVGS